MADPKRKTHTALRTPGPKKKLGLVVPPPLRMPHEELITSAPSLSEIENPTLTSQTSPTSQGRHGAQKSEHAAKLFTEHNESPEDKPLAVSEPEGEKIDLTMTSQTSQTSHSQIAEPQKSLKTPVAPDRDFTRVANSIAREAVPAGVFKGKSKLLYDCLYRMTRGAVAPSRNVRISRPKLMKAAGIGSRVTFEANISHLCRVGLIEVKSIAGEHNGNEYTVYIPEEAGLTMTSQTSQTSLTGYAQKLVRLVSLETSQTRHTLSPIESTILPGSKTSSNTTTDDDDGIAGFTELMRTAAAAVIGHDLPKSEVERERWKDLGALLSEELMQAAERAGQISSVPAFFAAHLRRRLKTGQLIKNEQRPDPQMVKAQAAALSKEQKLLKMIKELHMLHVGDPDYTQSDLIDDLKFRCQKADLEWDEAMVQNLLQPVIEEGKEGN